MNFVEWIISKVSRSEKATLTGDFTAWADLAMDVYIREMAYWSAVNIMANAISKCEFKTYVDGKEVKGAEYYLWNVSPNINQNASEFVHKWISQLYRHNECLMVEQNGQLLVADSFNRKEYALYDDIFSEVAVGDFTFARTFKRSEVLYYKLSEVNMTQVLDRMYSSYSKLINYTISAYQKSRGSKGVFTYETLPIAGSEDQKRFNDLLENQFKAFLLADSSVIPLGKGQTYTELVQRTYSPETTRDIRAQIDDIYDFTARALTMPPALLKGNVVGVDGVVNELLTFAVDPLAGMLSKGINKARGTAASYAKGTYLKIDTSTIKHVDVLSSASAIDKLISSATFSINDVLKLLNMEPINELWANEHFITKNYMRAEDALSQPGGGET